MISGQYSQSFADLAGLIQERVPLRSALSQMVGELESGVLKDAWIEVLSGLNVDSDYVSELMRKRPDVFDRPTCDHILQGEYTAHSLIFRKEK